MSELDELREKLDSLQKEWDVAKTNLLWPTLIRPGTLRFGGNAMQLDHNGIQMRVSTGTLTPIYFVRDITPTPLEQTELGLVQGELSDGRAVVYVAATALGAAVSSNVEIGAETSRHWVSVASAQFRLKSVFSPAEITATQNNYAPTNFGFAAALRLTSDASRDITGLDIGDNEDGRTLLIFNVGAQNIVLKDENAGSDEENRFALNGDITLEPDNSVWLWYDGDSNRWRAA